jgi:hypothetical protein
VENVILAASETAPDQTLALPPSVPSNGRPLVAALIPAPEHVLLSCIPSHGNQGSPVVWGRGGGGRPGERHYSGEVTACQTQRQGRRAERLGSGSGGSADLSKFVREVRFLAGGDVRCLALATISLAEVVAA